MSMYTLKLMSQAARREEDMVDAALDAFTTKQLPPFKDMKINAVHLKRGKLEIGGTWEKADARHFSADVTVDTKTGKGKVDGHIFLMYTGTKAEGELSATNRKALLKKVNSLIDLGAIPASRETRAAIARLLVTK